MKLEKLILPSVIAMIVMTGFLFWQYFSPQEEAVGPKTTGLLMKVSRSNWPGQYWKEIADKKGWFEEAGLKIELIDTNPDYYASLQEMVAGKLDVNSFPLFDLLNYVLNENNLMESYETLQ